MLEPLKRVPFRTAPWTIRIETRRLQLAPCFCQNGSMRTFAISDWVPDLTQPLVESWRADGVTALEPGPTFLLNNDKDQLAAETERLTSHGINIYACHAPFGSQSDLSAPPGQSRELALEEYALCLSQAAITGASCLVTHPSVSMQPGESGQRMDLLRKSLEVMLEKAQEAGVRIALENMLPDHLCCDAASLRGVVDEFDSPFLGICFDTGHSHITSGRVAEDFAILRDRIIAFHLQDNDRSGDQHVLPSHGTIDWKILVPLISAMEPDFPMTIEVKPSGGMTQGQLLRDVTALFERSCVTPSAKCSASDP